MKRPAQRVSDEDPPALEETLDILADRDAIAEIRAADAAYGEGDVVRGIDAVRHLRPMLERPS